MKTIALIKNNRLYHLVCTVLVLSVLFSCVSPQKEAKSASAYQTVAPGTIEDKTNPLMKDVAAAHNAIDVKNDEVVIYYLRKDKDYKSWGFWLWRIPDGDGSLVWEKTKNLQEIKGVGFFRFKKDGSTLGTKIIADDGRFGVIARQDSGWVKDGEQDRILDVNVSREWVIFEGDNRTYPYGEYRPAIESAKLVEKNKILLSLSGRYGLDLEKGTSGFLIKSDAADFSVQIADSVNADSPGNKKHNFAKKVLLILSEDLPLDKTVIVEHKDFLKPVVVDTSDFLLAMADSIAPQEDYTLGAIYNPDKKSVEFRLWSPFAHKVTVRLYKKNLAAKPDYQIELSKDKKTGVWTAVFDKIDPDGMFYDYLMDFGSWKTTALDPYAKAMDVFTGSGIGRGAIINHDKAQPIGGWENYTDIELKKREDAIIYEVSVRDFTISPDANVKNRPGSYLAFIEKIPYLKELGVTHVQLMPVLNFYYNNEENTAYEKTGRANDNNYNWGYDPHNYFTPEGWFSTNPRDPYNRIIELKTLIKELHKAGIGVILDVVYNHTANTAIFENLVPGYYYRRGKNGAFIGQSGCGNDIASERYMAGKLIKDSLYYWVKEYNVDGFRFDLMGLIDADVITEARKKIAEEIPGKDDILFEGEGWKMYSGPKLTVLDQNYMTKTNEISVFNDEFRDLLKAGGLDDKRKAFLTGKPSDTRAIFENLAGRPTRNYKADDPGDSMNYVSAHDNLTLADNIAYNRKLNPQLPADRKEISARAKLANFMVLTSQSIAFIHSGAERGRSKPKKNSTTEITGNFVHNSYDASDDINQFVWNTYQEYTAMAEWVKGLIHIRKKEEALHIGDAAIIKKAMKQIPSEDKLSIGYSVEYKGTKLTMLVNANNDKTVSFELGQDLNSAKILVDSDEASPDGIQNPSGFTIENNTIKVEPLTAIMLKN